MSNQFYGRDGPGRNRIQDAMGIKDRGALAGMLGRYGQALVLQTITDIYGNVAKLAPDYNDYLLPPQVTHD